MVGWQRINGWYVSTCGRYVITGPIPMTQQPGYWWRLGERIESPEFLAGGDGVASPSPAYWWVGSTTHRSLRAAMQRADELERQRQGEPDGPAEERPGGTDG